MSKKDTALLKSLIGYVNDVKPYHTKFREITSELYFSDKFNVTVKDSHFIEAFFQNTWDRDSIGGETLYRMSNQLESDKVFTIPPSIYPRLTTITRIGSDQVPVEVLVTKIDHEFMRIDDDGTTLSFDYILKITVLDTKESQYGWDPESLHIIIDGVPYIGSYSKTGSVITIGEMFTKNFPSILDSATKEFVDSIKITSRKVLNGAIGATFPPPSENNPGIGYKVDDVLTVTDGRFDPHGSEDPVKFVVTVTTENGGISGFSVINAGNYIVVPTNPAKVEKVVRVGDTEFDDIPFEYESFGESSFAEDATFTLTWDEFERLFSETLTPLLKAETELRMTSDDVKVFYLNTGRYSVPFHQGSKVKINDTEFFFFRDYLVDADRSSIQFLAGKHPAQTDTIEILIYRSDKLFIAYHDPFNWKDTGVNGYDIIEFDDYLYDRIEQDTFIIEIDSSLSTKAKVSFYDTETNKNKAELTIESVRIEPGYAANGDVYQVKAIGPWKFTVQKVYPTVGEKKIALFKTKFTDGSITFTIDRKWSKYFISSNRFVKSSALLGEIGEDAFVFPESMLEDFESSALDPYVGQEAFHYLDLRYVFNEDDLDTYVEPEAGSESYYVPRGQIVKIVDSNSLIEGSKKFQFILDRVPPFNSYIELRVDQSNQYNPQVNVSIVENLTIFAIESTNLFEHHGFDSDMYDFEGDCQLHVINSSEGRRETRLIANSETT